MKSVCKVCDRQGLSQHRKVQFCKDGYCSLYCQMFDQQKLKKYKPNKNPHLKHMEYFPPILAPCENCGEDVELRWNLGLSNRAFCNQDCNNDNRSNGQRRRSLKHYPILKILKHSGEPLKAESLALRASVGNRHHHTVASVSSSLRYYTKKGFVVAHQHNGPTGFRTYEMAEWAKKLPIKQILL